MIISPCISICKTDPVTGYCYGCGRSNEDKIKWKDTNTTEEWKIENLKTIEWGNIEYFDMIINATSLGLNNEKINLDFSNAGKNKLFYDVIYNPAETNFLKNAKKNGNLIENGKLMFVYQALEAFKLWHEVEPKISNEIFKLLENDY